VSSANDGLVMSANLDGSDVGVIILEGKVHTPKQLIVDHDNETLYFCDKEGQDAKTRSDIELLFDGLPEPIDLEIVSDSQVVYWTDRE
jgi:hypothetical protein